MNIGFKPSELGSSYKRWQRLIKEKELSEDTQRWLYAWESYDFMNSPMRDKERRLLRQGHYVGWFNCFLLSL